MSMSDETSVERRLRGQADVCRRTPGMRWSKEEQEAEAAALDCGREAIRLLRNIARDHGNSDLVYALGDFYADSINALLARCTEGPR